MFCHNCQIIFPLDLTGQQSLNSLLAVWGTTCLHYADTISPCAFQNWRSKQKVLWNDRYTAQNHTLWKSQNRVNITGKLPRSYTSIFTCLLIVGAWQDFNQSINNLLYVHQIQTRFNKPTGYRICHQIIQKYNMRNVYKQLKINTIISQYMEQQIVTKLSHIISTQPKLPPSW